MLAKDFNRYKIGITSNVVQRMRDIQTGCPCETELVVTSMGLKEHEKFLHCKYEEFKVYGEWFELPEAEVENLLRDIEAIRRARGAKP